MISDGERRMLNEPIPERAVAERRQAGQTLSYVQGWWVISELNRIFPYGWSYEVETAEACRIEEPSDKGPRWRVTYRARCVLRVRDVVIADVGHGHGIDRYVGQAIESAEKEAATDALKRCAKSLGWRLGLALYDASREYVVDDTAAEQARVLERWDTMSDREKRATWATLSPEMRERIAAKVKAARDAKQRGPQGGPQGVHDE